MQCFKQMSINTKNDEQLVVIHGESVKELAVVFSQLSVNSTVK